MTSERNALKEQPNTWTRGGQAKSSDVAATMGKLLAVQGTEHKHALPQFPQGLISEFEVVNQEGETGSKTWVLRDVKSQIAYELSQATIEGWDIPAAPAKGPSIIVALKPSMVAMHLPTGEFYCDAQPPSRVRRKR